MFSRDWAPDTSLKAIWLCKDCVGTATGAGAGAGAAGADDFFLPMTVSVLN
jgi:hypothetical protein